jgi:hypothetical protein
MWERSAIHLSALTTENTMSSSTPSYTKSTTMAPSIGVSEKLRELTDASVTRMISVVSPEKQVSCAA